MGSVTVRFIAEGSFVSGAIRRLTGSLFSHVELGTPEGAWIGAHLEDGVQERPANYCAPTREYLYRIPCPDWQERYLLTWARAKIGDRYNALDIVGLMFQARSLRSPHRYICSQFVCEGLLCVFGARHVLNVLPQWDYRITPETLHLSPIFVGHLASRVG